MDGDPVAFDAALFGQCDPAAFDAALFWPQVRRQFNPPLLPQPDASRGVWIVLSGDAPKIVVITVA